jgi:hypothetical protein
MGTPFKMKGPSLYNSPMKQEKKRTVKEKQAGGKEKKA